MIMVHFSDFTSIASNMPGYMEMMYARLQHVYTIAHDKKIIH